MPLIKLPFKPGVNRENTRYTVDQGWYASDKVRFRYGTPEKIGGWERISEESFLGVCRSLWAWATLFGYIYVGMGTNLKFYIQDGGSYFDITPYRTAVIPLTDCFTTDGTTTVQVTDVAHGCVTGDFVHIDNVVSSGGDVNGIPDASLEGMFQVTVLDADNYTIVSPIAVEPTPFPAHDRNTQKYVELPPVQENGAWRQVWQVVELPAEEQQKIRDARSSEVRKRRDLLLTQSDWTQMPDATVQDKAVWLSYRQALRDVPGQTGFPFNVDWPVRP